ncbi:hypothetical protein [Oribacterium parvum]|uniref:hypothetical protein n=1 Tax=Oribacterium parvum TaxID=1501329 RepID=UPI0028ED2DCF|nr:hypothetical protein [Oribacterium parvum]
MKRKKIIPLLLALSLSSSVFSFGPTWGEPANESGNPFLTGEDGEEAESSVTSGSNMDFTHYSALEDRASGSNFPGGEEFKDPVAFEQLNTKQEFYHYFDEKLDPIPVSINLDNDKYYEVKDGRAYYLELSGNANSNPILAKLAKTIREKIDPSPSLSDDMALGGLLPSYGVMAGGNPFAIRFKKFEDGKKLAYLVWQGSDEASGKPGKKYLIPLKGTSSETFNFIVSGNVNQFNLPKNKEICDHNMGEIISFLKENYPEIKEIHFTDRNIKSEGEGREKQYYYDVEYTDEHGKPKPARVNVGSLQSLGEIREELVNFLSKNLSFPFDEGRFENNPSFTEEELAEKNTLTEAEIKEIKGKFNRIINNALTGVLSVEVEPEIARNVDVRMVAFTHGETPDYGIQFTVKTEKSGDVGVTLPITYSAALNVSSVFSLENSDLENLQLSPDKNYVYEKRGTGNAVRSLKEYLKSSLKEGEKLRTPVLKDKVLPPDGVYLVKYNKEILYPVYKDGEFVRNLRVNLNDAMSEETGYHNYIFAKNMRYDGDKMEDDFPVILITEEDKKDIEKVLRTELGESLASVEFPNGDKVQTTYGLHFVKTTLHFVDGSSEDLRVYLTGNLESLPSFGEQPLYKLESDRICGGEVIRPEDPKTPENPTEPVNPTNPVNPVNPDNGNRNGNGGGNGGGNSGGGSRTPIVEESQTPAVLSASREAVSSNAEVLGEERPTPTVLGVERKGRGFVKTEDRSNPFSFTLFGISVIGLAFWALQEKKKRT